MLLSAIAIACIFFFFWLRAMLIALRASEIIDAQRRLLEEQLAVLSRDQDLRNAMIRRR
jgi:hypothetical protein